MSSDMHLQQSVFSYVLEFVNKSAMASKTILAFRYNPTYSRTNLPDPGVFRVCIVSLAFFIFSRVFTHFFFYFFFFFIKDFSSYSSSALRSRSSRYCQHYDID